VPIATLGTATASGHSTFCGGASSDSTVYDTTQVTTRPILYEAQRLKYPAKARARGVEGRGPACGHDQCGWTSRSSIHPDDQFAGFRAHGCSATVGAYGQLSPCVELPKPSGSRRNSVDFKREL